MTSSSSLCFWSEKKNHRLREGADQQMPLVYF